MMYFGDEATRPYRILSVMHSQILIAAALLRSELRQNDKSDIDEHKIAIGLRPVGTDPFMERIDQAIAEIAETYRSIIHEEKRHNE